MRRIVLIPKSMRTFAKCTLLLGILALMSSDSIANTINVFDINGDWATQGNGRLSRGTSLNVGDMVQRKSSNRSDFIVIKSQGKTVASVFCNRQACSGKMIIKSAGGAGDTFWNNLWEATMRYWSNTPRYFVTIIKGGLADDIVAIDENGVDMTDYFGSLKPEKYELKFIDLANPKSIFQIEVDTVSSKGIVQIGGLKAGLYEISRLKDPADTAWILIVPKEKYAKSAEAIAKFREKTALWKDEVQPAILKGYRRTCFTYLADNKFHLPLTQETPTPK